MSYELITQYTATGQSDRSAYGWNGRPNAITHHWWNTPDKAGNFLDTIGFFTRAGANTSAHYVVSGKQVACLVSPDRAAWHTGSTLGNGRSIGIEIDPRLPEGTLETVAQLSADLEKHYGSMEHYGHKDWSATACPGIIYDRIGGIIDLTNKILGGTYEPSRISTTPSVPANNDRPEVPCDCQNPAAEGPHWVVEPGDTMTAIAHYYYGEASAKTLEMIRRYNNMADVNRISVGQKVYIPGPLVWVVEPGDTWAKIDAYYGYASGSVQSRNPGVALHPGVVLKVWG